MNIQTNSVERWTAELLSEGYCIIPNALPVATIGALNTDLDPTFERTPFCQGGFYGDTTKRFGRLLSRSEHTASLVQHRTILSVVEALLSPYCDTVQLNVTQAIAVHPGAPAQLPHRDQDMWRGPVGEIEYLVNVIWPLTEFTADNGATLVWPRSHGAKALDVGPDAEPVAAAMEPGSALIFLGSALHGAGENRSATVRRGLVVGYALGWLKPYENQWLAYPPPVARRFSPELAALVGYRQHRPNLGNYEGRCPSILLGDDVCDHLAAIDALRPDQEEAIAAYVQERRRGS
ncbi:phytanoyl-CoA dioxygenase family protein [Sphingomonas sp. UYP23]